MAQLRDKSPRHSWNSADTSAAPPALRFALGWAALVYALSTLTLGYPALAGKFLVNPNSDQYKAGYAFREFAASTLRATGHFPLWDPYLFGGMPYIAAMHGDIFYPTFLLRMIMPTDVAMTWGFIIHIFLAGLLTYLFLRDLGYGFFGRCRRYRLHDERADRIGGLARTRRKTVCQRALSAGFASSPPWHQRREELELGSLCADRRVVRHQPAPAAAPIHADCLRRIRPLPRLLDRGRGEVAARGGHSAARRRLPFGSSLDSRSVQCSTCRYASM